MVLRSVSPVLAAAALVLAGAAQAQEAVQGKVQDQAQDQTLDTVKVQEHANAFRQLLGVEVTGTAIVNPKARERLPLTVITRRDIERSAAGDLMSLLRGLPMSSNSRDSGLLGGGRSEAVALGLRGEPESTLVLLNGVRLPTHSVQTPMSEVSAVDLNLIPLLSVERIEILREGASTLYGSDAVAGVVNIITRSDLRGFAVSSRHEWLPGGSGQRNAVDVAWGVGQLAKDGYQLLAAASRQRHAALRASDRPSVWEPRVNIGQDSKAPFVWPANVYDLGARRYLLNPAYGDGQCGAQHVYAGEQIGRQSGLCYFDRTSLYSIYPAESRTQWLLQARLALGAGHVLALEHARTESERTGVVDSAMAYQSDAASGRAYVLGLGALAPVTHPREELFARSVVSLQGKVAQQDYKLTWFGGQQKAQSSLLGYLSTPPAGYFTAQELATPLSDLGADTRAKIAALQTALPYQQGTSRSYGVEGKLSGTRALASGLDAQYALGLGWRAESLRFEREFSGVDILGQRHASYVFGEWVHAINEALSVAAGARADQYSDVGQASALKVSARYQPDSNWMLRGAWGNGFRAPSLALTHADASAISTTSVSVDGRPVYVFAQGNPDLTPEKSTHLTLGAQWALDAQWALSLDWWALHSRGLVFVPDASVLASDPVLRQRYVRAFDPAQYSNVPSNALGLFIQPQNLARREQQGLDYQFNYRHPLEQGIWRLQWQGTWMLRSGFEAEAGAGLRSDLGHYLSETARYMPRHRWALSAALEPQANERHQLTWNHLSGNTEIDGTGQTRRVGAHWTLDWISQWALSQGLLLRVGVRNLTDRLPPSRSLTPGAVPGVDTRYGDFRGRYLMVSLDHKF